MHIIALGVCMGSRHQSAEVHAAQFWLVVGFHQSPRIMLAHGDGLGVCTSELFQHHTRELVLPDGQAHQIPFSNSHVHYLSFVSCRCLLLP